MIRRLLRAPLLHCLVLGALCYGLFGWELPVIRIDAASIEGQVDDMQRLTGHALSAQQRQALIDNAVREELLLREAKRRQLHHLPVVQQRLVQLAEFLQLSESTDPAVLRRQAENLGLLDQDPVIRRYLVNTLELILAEEAAAVAPSDSELRRYYEDHIEDFWNPRRVDLRQLYFAGDDAEARAQDLISALQQGELNEAEALQRSDSFYGGREWRGLSDYQMGAKLGREFVAAFNALPALQAGRWYGPLPSAYGVHLVWVESIEPAHPKPFAQVESLIRASLKRQQQADHLATQLAQWRTRYRIDVIEASAG